jgi:hypothetical protein
MQMLTSSFKKSEYALNESASTASTACGVPGSSKVYLEDIETERVALVLFFSFPLYLFIYLSCIDFLLL